MRKKESMCVCERERERESERVREGKKGERLRQREKISLVNKRRNVKHKKINGTMTDG